MKIVIIGGHLTPALSVIEELQNKEELIYFGRKYALEGDKALSLEFQTINDKDIHFEEIKSGRIQRSFTSRTIPSISKIPIGFYQSYKALKKYKPDVVIGFGGYLSFPVILVAKYLGIPTLIHEQTLEAGEANKQLARFADKVLISFESSKKYFPKEKVIITGNPIRKSIVNPNKKFLIKKKDPIIYITGGSQGSHFINQLIKDCLSQLLEKYFVIHQTGGATEFNDFENLSDIKNKLSEHNKSKYKLSKFFSTEEVGGILKSADLVVSRSGINSISELIKLKKPALLIPLPVTQKNEQLNNAKFLKDLGLGDVSLQNDLNPEEFLFKINIMVSNIDDYKLRLDIDYFSNNSAKKIVDAIYDIQKNSN